jgi:hypothetical protein
MRRSDAHLLKVYSLLLDDNLHGELGFGISLLGIGKENLHTLVLFSSFLVIVGGVCVEFSLC